MSLILSLFFITIAQALEPLETVKQVDLKLYQGRWNEIYSIPNSFQENCYNVTADYKLEGSNVVVINTCRDKVGNITKKVIGQAKPETDANSRLKVSFSKVLGINFYLGDYWILALGPVKDGQYTYALVGEPKRKYSWILSRSSKLSAKELKTIQSVLNAQGYSFKDFRKTRLLP